MFAIHNNKKDTTTNTHTQLLCGIVALAASLAGPAALGDDIPRLANGQPDLSGTYDVSTLTPLQRPKEFGNSLELTREQADAIVEANRQRIIERDKNRGPITSAPPAAARKLRLETCRILSIGLSFVSSVAKLSAACGARNARSSARKRTVAPTGQAALQRLRA